MYTIYNINNKPSGYLEARVYKWYTSNNIIMIANRYWLNCYLNASVMCILHKLTRTKRVFCGSAIYENAITTFFDMLNLIF